MDQYIEAGGCKDLMGDGDDKSWERLSQKCKGIMKNSSDCEKIVRDICKNEQPRNPTTTQPTTGPAIQPKIS